MRSVKLLFYFFIFLFSPKLMAAFPTNGDGTVNNPYKIFTLADLNSVRDDINNAGGLGKAVAYYELTNNIDVSTIASWTGIGKDAANPFKGQFDGKGFKITGIKKGTSVDARASGVNLTGLFGIINGATIINLEVNIAFYVTNQATILAGGLISQIAGGNNLINNCKVTGIIDAFVPQFKTDGVTAVINTPKAAGIAAQVVLASVLTVVNTSVEAMISSQHEASAYGAYAGGFVAEPAATATINIVNCYVQGSVSAKNTFVYPTSAACTAGGILASGYTTTTDGPRRIINCYAANSVEGYTYVGGVSGSLFSNPSNQISNCIALNPYIYGGSGNTTIYRICPVAGNALSSNYALTNLDIRAGSTPISVTSSSTGSHGENLSVSDYNTQSKVKLNQYISTNPNYNGIVLKTWINGVNYPKFGTVEDINGIKNINLRQFKYSIKNDNFTIENIDRKTQLEIFTISGTTIYKSEIDNEFTISLPRGIYIVALEGFKNEKIII